MVIALIILKELRTKQVKDRIWEGIKNVGVQIKAERKITGENVHGNSKIIKIKACGREEKMKRKNS